MRSNFLLILIVLLVSIGGEAQGTSVEGLVEIDGAVVSNARVTLEAVPKDNSRSDQRVSFTDSTGRFSFSNVVPGLYRVGAKVSWVNREFGKQISVTSNRQEIVLTISLDPCSEEKASERGVDPPDSVAAEIVRELIELSLQKDWKASPRPILFVPVNIDPSWLTESQRSRLSVVSREEVQRLTEKSGSRTYYSIGRLVMYGNCVGVSLLNNVTIPGQVEDANMAGGGAIYEFRRRNGKWVGEFLTGWIS